MYAYIKGTLVKITSEYAVVDNGGIGFYLLVPGSALRSAPQIGSPVLFYTSFIVRELSQALYGFFSEDEKEMFETLISVSGIGPKGALGIIGSLSLGELCLAIRNQDLRTMTRIPGVGKKTAERLMIELRDKLPLGSVTTIAMPTDVSSQTMKDAIAALMNLGYNQAAAQKAVQQTIEEQPEEADLSTVIRHALQLTLKNF